MNGVRIATMSKPQTLLGRTRRFLVSCGGRQQSTDRKSQRIVIPLTQTFYSQLLCLLEGHALLR